MALPGRTTAELVGGIIDLDASIEIDPFIDAANSLVTKVCAVIPVGGYEYTSDDLMQIETWLTAHFYAIDDPRSLLERVGSLSRQIESKVDLSLDVTRYGQMAKILDVNGGLAALQNAQKAVKAVLPTSVSRTKIGIKWLGTPPQSVSPYTSDP